MKLALLAIQALGALAAAALLAVTFLDQDAVETRLQSFAVAKVEDAADDAWVEVADQLDEGGRAERLGALASRFGLQADQIDAQREVIVPALIAYALSDRCADDCGFALVAGIAAESAMLERAAQLRVGQQTVAEFLVARYESSVQGLIADLRRFGAVTLLVLLLAMGLTGLRDYLNWRFAAFSTALTGYTAYAAYSYVFDQNWALSILLQDWAAPAYQAGMIAVAIVLADWLFLRGFFTKMIGNAIGSLGA